MKKSILFLLIFALAQNLMAQKQFKVFLFTKTAGWHPYLTDTDEYAGPSVNWS